MGLPEGWVTDLVPNRRALHTLGNGVVPQQAAAAIRLLVDRPQLPRAFEDLDCAVVDVADPVGVRPGAHGLRVATCHVRTGHG